MKKENLIAYAMSFVSFLLDNSIFENINSVILFGSVARGNFDEESDIDLFIDTKKDIEKDVFKMLSLFQQSEIQKKWTLKGLKNELSLKVGELNKWKLKRDILTDGVVLYGKFKEVPENINYYLLINLSFKKFSRAKKVKLWRKLYGYNQKVGKKTYKTKGLTEKLEAKRLENCMIISVKNKKEFLDFLNKERINYTINEVWSDNL